MTNSYNRLSTMICFSLLLGRNWAYSNLRNAHINKQERRVKNIDIGHFEAPVEQDVINPDACVIDSSGFGGSSSSNSFTVSYYQEIEYVPFPETIEDIIKDVETATVDAMLASAQIFCSESRRSAPSGGRSLVSKRAVGMSANPDDEILELECQQIDSTEGNECVVVESGFKVFYVGEGDANDKFEESFQDSIKQEINDNSLVDSNSQIVQIKHANQDDYASQQQGSADPDKQTEGTVVESSGNALPIIIGALAGTLLIGAAVVAYRRSKRNNANTSNGNDGAPEDSPHGPEDKDKGEIE